MGEATWGPMGARVTAAHIPVQLPYVKRESPSTTATNIHPMQPFTVWCRTAALYYLLWKNLQGENKAQQFLPGYRMMKKCVPVNLQLLQQQCVFLSPHFYVGLFSCRVMVAQSIQQRNYLEKECQGRGSALSFHINYCYYMGFRDKHKTELE